MRHSAPLGRTRSRTCRNSVWARAQRRRPLATAAEMTWIIDGRFIEDAAREAMSPRQLEAAVQAVEGGFDIAGMPVAARKHRFERSFAIHIGNLMSAIA